MTDLELTETHLLLSPIAKIKAVHHHVWLCLVYFTYNFCHLKVSC